MGSKLYKDNSHHSMPKKRSGHKEIHFKIQRTSLHSGEVKLPLPILPPPSGCRVWKPPVHSAELRHSKVPVHKTPTSRMWKRIEADDKRRPRYPSKQILVFATDPVAELFWYRFALETFGPPRLDQESGYWAMILQTGLNIFSSHLERDTIPTFYRHLSESGKRKVTARTTWNQIQGLVIEAERCKMEISGQESRQVIGLFQAAMKNEELLNNLSSVDFALARKNAPSPILTHAYLSEETALFIDMVYLESHRERFWLDHANAILLFWNVRLAFSQFVQRFATIRQVTKCRVLFIILVSEKHIVESRFGNLAREIQAWLPRSIVPTFFVVQLDQELLVHSIVEHLLKQMR